MPKKNLDILKPVQETPEKVTTFVSNPAGWRNQGYDVPALKKFPEELLECKNLTELTLYNGLEDPTLPEEIGKLKNLKELHLGRNGHKTLPEGLGELSNLRTLDIAYDSLESLPETIGNLKNLEELVITGCFLTTLPKSLAQCDGLRKLSLSGNTGLESEACEIIWQLKTLEELILPDTLLKLPKGICQLKNLKSLYLSGQALKSIKDEIAGLHALKSLEVRSYEESEKIDELPGDIGELTELENLDVSFLGLKKLPPLNQLKKLKSLSVVENQLEQLYETVVSLPALEEIDFSDNPFIKGEKKKIAELMNQKNAVLHAAVKPKILKKLGKVVGQNSTLIMLAADATVAQDFQGVNNGWENSIGSDWDRLSNKFLQDGVSRFNLKEGYGLGFGLDMGQGIVSIWQVDDHLVLFEGFTSEQKKSWTKEDGELFKSYLAQPAHNTKPEQTFEIKSGILVFLPSTDAGQTVGKLVGKKLTDGVQVCGIKGDENGLAIAIPSGTYGLFLDKEESKSAWGHGIRGVIRLEGKTSKSGKTTKSSK